MNPLDALHVELKAEFSTKVNGLLLPEDVNLTMSEGYLTEKADYRHGKYLKMIREVLPRPLGSIVITMGKHVQFYETHLRTNLLFLGVVYDFSKSPPCREQYVLRALLNCFRKIEEFHLKRLALTPLGTCYGGISLESFVGTLLRALRYYTPQKRVLRELFLLTTEGEHEIVSHVLEGYRFQSAR